MIRGAPGWGLAIAALAVAPAALASPPMSDPYELPDVPRPLSLPELTHPDIEWTTTTTVGSVSSPHASSAEVVERIAVELPIAYRRFFAGAAYELADGPAVPSSNGNGSPLVGGNVELYGRTVWATRTGLAFGGGLGVLPPIASFTPDVGGGSTALAAISLQPWDYAFFRVGELTVRPFIDVRDLFGRFVVQFRQSFDWSTQTRGSGGSDVAAASMLYLGFVAAPILGIGLETAEYYRISAAIPDGQRDSFIITPSVRFLTPGIQPALAAFVGAGSPVDPAAQSVWGVRLAVTFVWDPSRPFFRALQLFE